MPIPPKPETGPSRPGVDERLYRVAPRDNQLEDQILQILGQNDETTSIRQLAQRIRAAGTQRNDYQISKSFWLLVDEQKVILRADRKIQIAPTEESNR